MVLFNFIFIKYIPPYICILYGKCYNIFLKKILQQNIEFINPNFVINETYVC